MTKCDKIKATKLANILNDYGFNIFEEEKICSKCKHCDDIFSSFCKHCGATMNVYSNKEYVIFRLYNVMCELKKQCFKL